ncbi:VanZ family protein [Bariatricus massiliensis]|uniref:VanZ family protein n=1 Tax=Bariatricus massiliensis TaxID=1745713 RepID=A0ABS8DK10_9FIRM|nr:VanZ family protein [Bariatricus massiliensis]MCB7376109.1 VanZ family protein [Bariatricus massiliensis]MCB7388777.1 VanZ family protein [Bariatricus massiliensis]MCB7412950.1 VanZ family protein [Bariatricus massiliensis]MCQ5253256.1 VanZ family protein [Bariatricus massiliensis]
MSGKKQKCLTTALFTVYVLAIIWIILFKMQLIPVVTQRSLNLIPFGESVIVNGKLDISEIIYNLLIFVPFGIYMGMLKPDWSFFKKAAPIFLTSLAFETLQFIFAIGATDITDLIGNTLGGIIGIGLYFVFARLFKGKSLQIMNILALIGTVFMVGLIGLLIIANL